MHKFCFVLFSASRSAHRKTYYFEHSVVEQILKCLSPNSMLATSRAMDALRDLVIDDLQIIGQSANRAIIFCFHLRRRRIICFDQHAAHERIRYEMLLDTTKKVENLDQIKSKACHGSLRAGERLTLGQCQTLIQNLLDCKVPFRCAHSRCGVCVLESLDRILYIKGIRNL